MTSEDLFDTLACVSFPSARSNTWHSLAIQGGVVNAGSPVAPLGLRPAEASTELTHCLIIWAVPWQTSGFSCHRSSPSDQFLWILKTCVLKERWPPCRSTASQGMFPGAVGSSLLWLSLKMGPGLYSLSYFHFKTYPVTINSISCPGQPLTLCGWKAIKISHTDRLEAAESACLQHWNPVFWYRCCWCLLENTVVSYSSLLSVLFSLLKLDMFLRIQKRLKHLCSFEFQLGEY